MSSIESINSGSVSFSGSKTKKSSDGKKPEKQKLTDKLARPVKDSFAKAYDGAEPTASLVADFAADNIIKAGVVLGGGLLLLAKSRKLTNGLTASLRKNLSEALNGANSEKKMNLFGKSIDVVKNTVSDIKKNNFEQAKKTLARSAAETKTTGEKINLVNSIKNAALKPVSKFDNESNLAKFIDKHFAKHAPEIKDKLMKVGVSNGSDLADTAIAVGATGVLTKSSSYVTDDVTSKDNKQLAKEAKALNFEKFLNTAQKVSGTLDDLLVE